MYQDPEAPWRIPENGPLHPEAVPPTSLPDPAPLVPLSPRKIDCDRQTAWVTTAILLVLAASVIGLFTWLDEWTTAATLRAAIPTAALLALYAWHGQRWPPIAHRHAGYRLDSHGLEIHAGVHWRSVVNVARSRIQHTDVQQGPIERRFGLGTLTVHTSGESMGVITLDGLAHADALAIRDSLLTRSPKPVDADGS